MIRYLSVCSGIEAATVAWCPLGWQAVAFAEVDAYPSAVLAHHYPHVPNYGDMTRFREWPDAALDLLVGGTPCQSFSVAGLRKGLADPRGNLALTFLAIADRYRPRWVVWENVPGVLSIDDGRAFGSLLGGLADIGYGFAYRVLDAQYFGLAQRRKRVFVVGHLGDWRRAAAVLFDESSLRGDPAPRRETGQVAPTVPSRRAAGGGLGTDFDCDGGLIAGAVSAKWAKGTGGPAGDECYNLTLAHALRADGFDASEDGTGRGTPLVPCAFDARQSDVLTYGDRTGPLDTDGHSMAVAFSSKDYGADAGDVASLRAASGGSSRSYVAADTLYTQGINHASTQETHAATLLRALREEVGAEAFTQWGLGILDSLLPAEVLRSRLHGCGLRLSADFSRRWLVYHALARPEAHSEGLLLAMREAERDGRASQGWRPPEQLARELGAYLSELSQPGAQAARFLRDLWQAAEGIGLLREALSAVQEVGRSARGEGQPVRATAVGDGGQPSAEMCRGGMPEAARSEGLLRDARATPETRQTLAVRRLTVEECEFLQGFPRGYTAIPYRGKPAADGPRYKALGNSIAVPVVRWIGERIQMVDSLDSQDPAQER